MTQTISHPVIPGQPGETVKRLQAVVEQVRFSSEATGYTVIMARPYSSSSKNIVFGAVGQMGTIREGESLYLSGTWNDSQYGTQLKVTQIEYPDLTGDSLKEFLVGGFLKGVGPSLGQEIWDTFGEKTATIFEKTPRALLDVKGIGESKLEKIKAAWGEVAGKRKALVSFAKMGLHAGIVRKIFEKWANPREAVEQIESNPYLLTWYISGVGFQTADQAAIKLGFSKDSPERIEAGLGYVLDEAAAKEGHCYLEKETLLTRVSELAGRPKRDLIESCLEALVQTGRVQIKSPNKTLCVYLNSLAKAEEDLAQQLRTRVNGSFGYIDKLDDTIKSFEEHHGIKLHKDQIQAIKTSCQNQVSVITGGPGTGKTTIIKGLIACFKAISKSLRINLCAPTGRAAKRMSESTGFPAATIHRLLGYNPHQGFAYHAGNPLPADVVICDESSMLDLRLATTFINAIKSGCRVIFVGDVNQLPSVGAGSVLKDIINSKVIPVSYLSQIYRQSDGSYIALNAHSILRGDFQGINLSNATDDFFFMGVQNSRLPKEVRQEAIKEGLLKCVRRLVDLGYSSQDIQVLCPMKQGVLGIDALNPLLQMEFNPRGAVLYKSESRTFREGDKVMQIKNNYDKDVFNGDIGKVISFGEEGLKVSFDGTSVYYSKQEISELTLAYAMTVHKAQGSESKVVITVISLSHYVMLSRPIFYTAVTRAKERCIIVGEMQALKQAVDNNQISNRNSNLPVYISRG